MYCGSVLFGWLVFLFSKQGRFYLGFFRVAPPGCGERRIKRLVILFVPGYTAGLPRFAPVLHGHEPLYLLEIFISAGQPEKK